MRRSQYPAVLQARWEVLTCVMSIGYSKVFALGDVLFACGVVLFALGDLDINLEHPRKNVS